MRTFSKYGSIVTYQVLCFLAIGCFYFSISRGLFAWFFPDELVATSIYNHNGFFKCIRLYYLDTTINRLAADFAVCSMAKTSTFFSPLMGWAIARLIMFSLVPLSMAYLLKEMLVIQFKNALLCSLIISSTALFVMTHDVFYMFGLDLAIYSTATISFFALIALFPKSLKIPQAFICWCILYAINLNSHEVFLVVSSLFIPLFAWYIRRIDKKIQIIISIYVLSAALTILAPGVAMRMDIWPSNGTFIDGFQYMLFSVVESIYLMSQSYILVSIIFLLGIICRLFAINKFDFKYKMLWVLLICSPIIYLIITSYLVGITPSLWILSVTPIHYSGLVNFFNIKAMIGQGGLPIRQELFLYVGLFLSVFLAGFLSASVIKRYVGDWFSIRKPIFEVTLFLFLFSLFIMHPDSVIGIKTLAQIVKNDKNVVMEALEKNYGMQHENILAKKLYRRNNLQNDNVGILTIKINNYLAANKNKIVSPASIELLHANTLHWYYTALEDPWLSQTMALYNVKMENP